MSELPLHLLTDAGFTPAEADSIVEALVGGRSLHGGDAPAGSVDLDDLPAEKKDALERFNLAVAADV